MMKLNKKAYYKQIIDNNKLIVEEANKYGWNLPVVEEQYHCKLCQKEVCTVKLKSEWVGVLAKPIMCYECYIEYIKQAKEQTALHTFESRLEKSKIPKYYLTSECDYKLDKVKRAYVKSTSQTVLFGDAFNKKTIVAIELLKSYALTYQIKYIHASVFDILSFVQLKELVSELKQFNGVILFDELSVSMNPVSVSILKALVLFRHNANKETIYTTEITPQTFEITFGIRFSKPYNFKSINTKGIK
jgi:hypothetical protein